MTLFTVVTHITALLLKGEAMFIHGTQLKQVFHTIEHGAERFAERVWVSKSQSLRLFYLSISTTVQVPFRAMPKCGTEPIRYVSLHFRDRRGALE